MAVSIATNRYKRLTNLWLPVIMCMGLIFYASSITGKDIPSLFPHEDILFHGAIYAILALFFYRALKNTGSRLIRLQLFIFTVIFGFAYGASDEFHQMFTPGRDCSGFDLIVDTIGTCAGGFIGVIFYKWLK
ncbi:MAG: VanZ family protein [Candidatus Omnitrophica bacterium]|nr:VanZ family protein [Candidatus Omnitrophota bacterium]